jgi:hypothetical protein
MVVGLRSRFGWEKGVEIECSGRKGGVENGGVAYIYGLEW